jgi:hypothetical protein
VLGIRPENTTRKSVTLTSILVPQWKPILNKLPGNAKLILNVNATVLYGLVQVRDLMIRKTSLNSTISDFSRLSPRMLAIATGLLVVSLLSDKILTQASQRHASAKISLYTFQTCVLMTAKIAYVPVM